jgi:conjugal transfer pilus assembly protein TraV
MRPRILFAGALLSSAALSGCTSLGGNVSGSFACRAPDGICAPSATIDDRALALISGSDGDRLIEPAGPYVEPPREGRGFQSAAAPVRTRERVLRIVFPAQIDAAGRLHEQSAVHAVVEQGEWREELASSAVATTPREVAAATGGDTLLAAVERAEPPAIDYAGIDPDMPSEAAVAAARNGEAAKPTSAPSAVADPVGDIKDQVSRKLTTPRRAPTKPVTGAKVSATPTSPAQNDGVASSPSPTSSAQPVATLAPVKPAAVSVAPAASAGIAVPAHATEAGKAAIASVAANPAVQGALHRAAPEAREAAKDASPLPMLKAKSFPGLQP